MAKDNVLCALLLCFRTLIHYNPYLKRQLSFGPCLGKRLVNFNEVEVRLSTTKFCHLSN